MAAFGGSYQFDENGYMTGYNQSGWDKFIGSGTEDEQRYMNEWNTALRQYEQQYALQQQEFALNKDNLLFNQNLATQQLGMQKEAQEANLANLKFNQDLATRQQDLSEESYRSGVLNQARQLSQLGINPAAQGGSITGLSMQGGSNVANASSGSASQVSGVSGRSVQGRGAQYQAVQVQKKMAKIQAMTAVLDFAQKAQSLRVSQQDADTRQFTAETDRMRQQTDAAKLPSEIESMQLQNDLNRLLYDDTYLSNQQLHALGISRETVKSWRNLGTPALVSLGGLTLVGNAAKADNWANLSPEEKKEVKRDVNEFVERAQEYPKLSDSQQSAFDEVMNGFDSRTRDIVLSYIPASTIAEWSRDPSYYTPERIRGIIRKFAGV